MQVMPSNPFLPSLLHQQFLARGLGAGLHHGPSNSPTTPPSSEDNMSPPPSFSSRHLAEDENITEKVIILQMLIRYGLLAAKTADNSEIVSLIQWIIQSLFLGYFWSRDQTKRFQMSSVSGENDIQQRVHQSLAQPQRGEAYSRSCWSHRSGQGVQLLSLW